ncbi:MAG: hypothetical protein WD595_00685 [Waddliaceae bacterium]
MKVSNNLYLNSKAESIGRYIEQPITTFAQNCLKHIVEIWKWELSTTEKAAHRRMEKLESTDVNLPIYEVAIDRNFEKGSKERLKQTLQPSHAKTTKKIIAFIPAILATVSLTALLILSVIPAAILRGTLQNYKAKITYIEPSNPRYQDTEKVRVMTWNIGLSEAELMNQINGLKTSTHRAPFQARKIINESATFIGLQEAFATHIVKNKIISPLSHEGYYTAYAARPKFLHGLNSGLLIASKYPIENINFKPLEKLEGADLHANKGVLIGMVNINGKNIVIANTHLNAEFTGNPSEKRKKRMEHMNEARAFIEEYYHTNGGDQIIFLGDLNVGRLESNFDSAYPSCEIDAITQLSEEVGTNSIVFRELTNNKDQPPLLINDEFQPIDQRFDPSWNESGEISGTYFDPDALNFNFVIKDIAWNAISKGATGTYAQVIAEVKRALSGHEVESSHIKDAIDEALKNTPKNANTLDHIFVSESERPYLSAVDYNHSIKSYLGPSGYLSDHSAVVVELNKS